MAKRERSRSYPGVNLEKTIDDTKKIRKNLGSGNLDREQLAVGLGYKKYNGNAGGRISAMVQFGLLDKITGGYCLSKLSEKITHPKDDDEYSNAINDSFHCPDLYNELMENIRMTEEFLSSWITYCIVTIVSLVMQVGTLQKFL